MVQINYIDLPSIFMAAQQARALRNQQRLQEMAIAREQQLPEARKAYQAGRPQMLQEIAPDEIAVMQHAELARQNAAAQQAAREEALAARQQQMESRNQADARNRAIATYRFGLGALDAIGRSPAAAPGVFDQLRINTKAKLIDPSLLHLPESGQLTPEFLSQARQGYQLSLEALERQQKQSAPKPKDPVEAATTLRKEFNGLQIVKDTPIIGSAWRKIQDASPTGPGDMSMVYGYMKLVDPGSTVREGEYATAENAGGVPSKAIVWYNKLLRGERLSDEMRRQFRSEASVLYNSHLKVYDDTAKEYRRLAEDQGLDPKDVVLPLGYRPKREQQQPAGPEGPAIAPGVTPAATQAMSPAADKRAAVVARLQQLAGEGMAPAQALQVAVSEGLITPQQATEIARQQAAGGR